MSQLGPVQTACLEALEAMYLEQRENLIAGGYSPNQARVLRQMWWEECLYGGDWVEQPSVMRRVERSLIKRGIIRIKDGFVELASSVS